jgi:serine/threonine protein kinase
MPLPAGAKLGPYETLAPIGAGGMGEAYKARDPRLGRDMAIKVSAARFSERFEREAGADGLGLLHICCGEIDPAADWFEKAIEERHPMVSPTLQSAITEPRRASPRWPRLAALMNLPKETEIS